MENNLDFQVKVKDSPKTIRIKGYMCGRCAYPSTEIQNQLKSLAGKTLTANLANVTEEGVTIMLDLIGAIFLYWQELELVNTQEDKLEDGAVGTGLTFQYTNLMQALELQKLQAS